MTSPAKLVRVVRTAGLCVLRQLRLEEALLRAPAEAGNWAVVNDGARTPAIVLGISGKPHALIDVARAHAEGVLVLKRFTGGGTVIVDEDTQFVSLLMRRDALPPDVPLFPEPLMRWTAALYGGGGGGRASAAAPGAPPPDDDVFLGNRSKSVRSPSAAHPPPPRVSIDPPRRTPLASAAVFRDVPGWRLRENDYAVGDLKIGGNAQSVAKDRFVHHTSFLWGFDPQRMRYLRNPEKQPRYRGRRDHDAFLTTLRAIGFETRATLPERLPAALRAIGMETTEATLEELEAAARRWGGLGSAARRTTAVVDLAAALEMGVDARAPVMSAEEEARFFRKRE